MAREQHVQVGVVVLGDGGHGHELAVDAADADGAGMGPSNGTVLIAVAAEAAMPARTSGSFWPSAARTQHWTWTSSRNPLGNSGRMGRSMFLIVRVSFRFGRAPRVCGIRPGICRQR